MLILKQHEEENITTFLQGYLKYFFTVIFPQYSEVWYRSKGGALFCHSENNDLPHGSVHWCFLYLALQIPCRDKEELLFTVALEKNPWWTFREQWSSKSIQCNALLGGWQAVLVWVRTGFIVIVFMHYTLSFMCMMIFDSKKKYIWNTKVPFHSWGRQI